MCCIEYHDLEKNENVLKLNNTTIYINKPQCRVQILNCTHVFDLLYF